MKEAFETINWDDFWQKKLEASFRERTQTALDDFEVVSVDHRFYAEKLVSLLQDKYPDAQFAANNCFGSWGIHVRTKTQRKMAANKLAECQEDAESIYKSLLKEVPLATLPMERRLRKPSGCFSSLLLLSLSIAIGVILVLG